MGEEGSTALNLLDWGQTQVYEGRAGPLGVTDSGQAPKELGCFF